METPRVSLMDCHDYWWWSSMFVKEIKSCRHTCLIQACTLQQPQLWPGALWWIWFFPFTFLPSAAPRKLWPASCPLPDIRSGCSWEFMKMVLQFPFSLCFSHSSRSSSWRAYSGGYFHFNGMEFFFWMHADSKRKVHMTMVCGIRIVTAVKIWMIPICYGRGCFSTTIHGG